MNQKERMLAGLPYKAWMDGLTGERNQNKMRIYRYNQLSPAQREEQDSLIREILGSCGESIFVETPFHCDYGYNISVGRNFYANYNLVILDEAPVTFGDNVFVAPNCGFYTAGHPVEAALRNKGLEYARPIVVGDNVWFGAGVSVLPGVIVGDNCVIGAGSVVTKDIPANSVAAGNPCKVIRTITELDKHS